MSRLKLWVTGRAILGQLDEMEDVYLAEKTLERIRKGKEKTYTLDEVEKELDLAG